MTDARAAANLRPGRCASEADPAFFARVVKECGCEPHQIAYVGDRLDNDIRPALAAGMMAVFIRRGPWGFIGPPVPDTEHHILVDNLTELPYRLANLDLKKA